jgi:zinc transport system substrate-binding protein
MKQTLLTIGGLIIALLLAGLIYTKATNNKSDNKLTVVGSFYPLAHFAQQVGGDKVNVVNITPAGSEPHDFEPSPRDLAAIQSAGLFLFNGLGLDSWATKIKTNLQNSGLTAIDMSKVVDTVDNDPHFWLNPVQAKQEVQAIVNGLTNVDVANTELYRSNADAYIAQLDQLDSDYRTGLANCRTREVVTSHAAFGYLAREYGLTAHAIAGLSPEAEPSAQQLSELATLVRERNIGYIFFETLASPKLAETLANEVGAQTLVFNPLEGLTNQEIAEGKTYISVMRENLANLRTALACQ